jgi:hypothetical protein
MLGHLDLRAPAPAVILPPCVTAQVYEHGEMVWADGRMRLPPVRCLRPATR